MIMPSKKAGNNERMHLHCRPFCWPCGGVKAVHAASPNAACPWLFRKPLYAAIGWLLAPYRPSGRQGDSKQNKDVICTHFYGRFDGHHDAAVLYCAHRPMKEVHGFHKSHSMLPSGVHSLQYYPIRHTNASCFWHFIVKKGSSWHVGPK